MEEKEKAAVVMGQRSTFITVGAWISIVVFGWATIAGVFSNIMLSMMPFDSMTDAISHSYDNSMPLYFRLMTKYGKLANFFFLVVNFLGLVSSIGLLKRMDWARKLFIGVLGFEILTYLVGAASTYFIQFPFSSEYQREGEMFVESFLTMGKIWMALFSILLAAALGWVIVKLNSPQIKAEFKNSNKSPVLPDLM